MKKNTVKKSVMATVLATSLFSSTGVGFANSSLQDMVDQARKDMKEASYAYVVPAQNGKITTSKDLYPALNIAKESYQKAKAAIEKSSAKNKTALLDDLEGLYNERIANGVIPYIDAYNYAAEYLNPIMEAIEKAEIAKDSAEVEKQLQKLSDQLKARSAIMYRFTGKAPRDLLLAEFKTPADQKHAQLSDSLHNEEGSIEAPLLYNSNPDKLTVTQVARYDSGQGETGTEILAYDEKLKKAFVTNGAVGGFDILSFADVKSGGFTQVDSAKRVVIEDYGVEGVKNITSIAAHPTEDLIAIAAYAEKTDPGFIIFATKDGKFVKSVQVGALPDMVTFSPDGKKAIVANEGEPNKDTTIDPDGSISIIDVASFEEIRLTFTEDMLDDKVRMSYQGKGSSYLAQLEPEYVTVSPDSKTAYVTLQENNAIATVDLVNNKIVSVKGLGVLDHSVAGNEMDANKDDKAIGINKAPILTWHMPDAIDTFVADGKTYIITPNEGDSRDYIDDGGYTEVAELADIELPIKLDASKYEGYTQAELDKFDLSTIEGYKVTTENGLNAAGTAYEAIYGYGGRSFSIFDAQTMEQVYDSGSEFERIIAEKTPQYFNTNSDEIKVDNRSDDKGPEPETAIVGEIGGTTYGFIALERYSGILVYDLTDVKAPKFVTLISSRDFSEDAAGDVSPEGLLFIPAEKSPTGKALLAATHEISGTVAVYEFGGKAEEANFELSIIHTNDTHAAIDNAPKRATIVKEVRKEKPNALLLDAGDVFQGTLYFTEYKGEADLALMNYMGYDAMTLGNHEFDLGKTAEGHQALADFVKNAKFPIVTANVDFSKDVKLAGLHQEAIVNNATPGNIYDGTIVEVDGEKVGIFGLTTETTAGSSSPDKVSFEDYLKEAEKAVASLEAQGIDKIVAISHLGYDNPVDKNDLLLAAKVDGIDVIVGGHSHTTLKEATVIDKDENGAKKDPTVIVQTGSSSANVGTLDVQFDDNGIIVSHANKLIAVGEQEEDAEAAAILAPFTIGISAVKNQETGGIAVNALANPRTGDPGNQGESVRNSETALGNLVADSMLAQGKLVSPNATIALQNGGGVRGPVDQGPITMGDVLTVLSFNNGLYSVDLTGAELKQVIEGGLSAVPTESGSFLHVAGLKIEFDSSKPAGSRVVSIHAADKDGKFAPVDDAKTYTVITNSYIAGGPDFASAVAAGRATDIGISDWESFAEYLKATGEVDPKIEGRTVDIASKK